MLRRPPEFANNSTSATRVSTRWSPGRQDYPDNPEHIRPQHVIDWVEQHTEDRAEAIFLAGNGFRVAQAVDALEARTGLLVLSANQAMLWGILAATATRWHITGYGRLLEGSTTPM